MSGKIRISFDIAEKFDKELINAINSTNEADEKLLKLKKIVRNIYKCELTKHQQKIYAMYYSEGKNSIVIAKELGISPQAVTKCLRLIRHITAQLIKIYMQ